MFGRFSAQNGFRNKAFFIRFHPKRHFLYEKKTTFNLKTQKHTTFFKAARENDKILITFPLIRSVFRDNAGDCSALSLKRLQKLAFWKQ
jgi:hypothetical protein